METLPVPVPKKQSIFVNVVCYILLASSLYNLTKIIIRFSKPDKPIKEIDSSKFEDWQNSFVDLLNAVKRFHIPLLSLSILSILIAIVLAIFALKRQSWARTGLVYYFYYKTFSTILGTIIALVTTIIATSQITKVLNNTSSYEATIHLTLVFLIAFVFPIVLMALYLWTIKRLNREDVKTEFIGTY